MPPTRRGAGAAKTAPAPASKVEAAPPFMSAGVHGELETWGRAVDPATGGVFERNEDTGKVTHTDRAGNVVEL